MRTFLQHINLFWLFAVLFAALPASTFACADTIPVQAVQTASRTVTLTWDSGFGTVSVSRQYPGEAQFSVITTTSLTTFDDHQHRSVCDDTVRYIVTNGTDSGYAAASVSDDEATTPAEWGIVSTDHTTGQITLQWTPSPDTDILGYLVYEGTPSFVVDTVFGRLNTQFAYPLEETSTVHQFRISALDSCRKSSTLTNPCNNIVAIISNEPCSQTYTITWNQYINMPTDVGSYEIWVSQDGGTYQRKAIVEQQPIPSGTFTVNVNCSAFKVYVRAVSSDGTLIAYSNLIEQDIVGNSLPQLLNLRRVSVEEPGQHVELLAETDQGWQEAYYTIYRRSEGSSPAVVAHCHPDSQGLIRWSDNDAKADQAVYTYYLTVTDACGNNTLRSNEASTILPDITNAGGNVRLAWNPYQGWDGTTSYNVYSSSDGIVWQFVENSSAAFISDLPDANAGQRQYKVVAYEGPDSHYRLFDSVQSAIVYHRPHTQIWMPNAFTPLENSNKSVAPQAVYISPEDYSFTIYNRHGLLIFSTTEVGQAWDGHRDGQVLPAGVYVYKITYRQSDGTRQQKVGTIMLIY